MTVRAYKLGALGQDDLTGILVLAADVTSNQYMTFETPVGTDYQVPTGKTFYITQILLFADTMAPAAKIGYGDNGIPDQAAAPTNWKAMTSDIKPNNSTYVGEYSLVIPIPALKYPAVLMGGQTAHITICGIEV